jgi:hypothetical protein
MSHTYPKTAQLQNKLRIKSFISKHPFLHFEEVTLLQKYFCRKWNLSHLKSLLNEGTLTYQNTIYKVVYPKSNGPASLPPNVFLSFRFSDIPEIGGYVLVLPYTQQNKLITEDMATQNVTTQNMGEV